MKIVTDLDVYDAAQVLVDLHGDAADIEAAKMVDEMADKNDAAGVAIWKRIMAAVDELLADASPKGMRTH